MDADGPIKVAANSLTRGRLGMPGCTLVCVGLEADDALPPGLQALADAGVFDTPILRTTPSEVPEHYWCDVLGALPDTADKVLVVSASAEITEDLLRLGALITDQVAVALPLSLQHEIARPLMQPGEALTLSAEDLNHWLNR